MMLYFKKIYNFKYRNQFKLKLNSSQDLSCWFVELISYTESRLIAIFQLSNLKLEKIRNKKLGALNQQLTFSFTS